MKDYLFFGGELVTSAGPVPNTGIIVMRGKIALPGAIRPDSIYTGLSCSLSPSPSLQGRPPEGNCIQCSTASCNTGTAATDCEEINAEGLYITPGFIDLHIHGGCGFDTLDGNTAGLRKMALFHARGGTTSFLPTIAAGSPEVMEKALATVSALYLRNTGGAALLGAHLEGPYLNPERAGCQNKAYFRPPDTGEMERLISIGDGCLKMVTLAPELPGAMKLMKLLNREGIVISAGHSQASYEETGTAITAGLRHAVHLFNASGPLHHRNPGLVGAVLTHREVTAEIVADGHHLHPAMLRLLLEIKGKRGLVLVTDAVRAAGMTDGAYDFAGQKIVVTKGKAELHEGRLAGSTITMIDAVKNVVNLAGLPLHEAIRMASLNPARVLGIEDQKGAIAPGMDADIVLMDKDFNIKLVMVQGEIVFNSLTPLKSFSGETQTGTA